MGALYGAMSALFIALTDVPGRTLNRRVGDFTTATTIQLYASLAAMVGIFVVDSAFSWTDAMLGAGAGVGMGTGLWFYYRGLSAASSAVVAPVVASIAAIVPYCYALLRGAEPSLYAVAGAAVCLVGLLIVTSSGERAVRSRAGITSALVSGTGYGVGISITVDVADGAGAWPAVTQRLAAFVLMALVAKTLRRAAHAPRGSISLGVLAGIFAGVTSTLYLLGLEADPSSTVVLGSLFPIGSVMVGRIAHGDEVTPRHVAGIAVVLLGVVAVVGG